VIKHPDRTTKWYLGWAISIVMIIIATIMLKESNAIALVFVVGLYTIGITLFIYKFMQWWGVKL